MLHTHTDECTYIHINICIHIYMCVRVLRRVYIHTYKYMYTYMYVCESIYRVRHLCYNVRVSCVLVWCAWCDSTLTRTRFECVHIVLICVCCSVLQCVAVCCMWVCVKWLRIDAHTTCVCAYRLDLHLVQSVAECCSVAVCCVWVCDVILHSRTHNLRESCINICVVQSVAECCRVTQSVAECCRV